jgi:hypothetical protein
VGGGGSELTVGQEEECDEDHKLVPKVLGNRCLKPCTRTAEVITATMF